MKNNRGISTIEILVIMTILLTLAALGFYFFGSVMEETEKKTSAVKIQKDLKSLADALYEYRLKEKKYPSSSDIRLVPDEMLNAGVLNSWPVVPDNWHDSSAPFAPDWDYRGAYAYEVKTGESWVNTAGNDVIVQLMYVREDLCKEFNKNFSKAGDSIPDLWYAIDEFDFNGASFCGKFGGTTNIIMHIVTVDAN